MVQKRNLPDDIFPCKDCVLIVHRRYTNHRMELNDLLDTLLIYEGSEVVKAEPIRKMSPGCRYCKGYFSYEMSFSPVTSSIVGVFSREVSSEMVKIVNREMKRKAK